MSLLNRKYRLGEKVEVIHPYTNTILGEAIVISYSNHPVILEIVFLNGEGLDIFGEDETVYWKVHNMRSTNTYVRMLGDRYARV